VHVEEGHFEAGRSCWRFAIPVEADDIVLGLHVPMDTGDTGNVEVPRSSVG